MATIPNTVLCFECDGAGRFYSADPESSRAETCGQCGGAGRLCAACEKNAPEHGRDYCAGCEVEIAAESAAMLAERAQEQIAALLATLEDADRAERQAVAELRGEIQTAIAALAVLSAVQP